MLLKEAINFFKNSLQDYYPDTEVNSLVNIIFEFLTEMSAIQIHANKNLTFANKKYEKLTYFITELKQYKPIQYLLGETEFYGIRLKVNSDVLIPRPETEELVSWIIEEQNEKNISIIDIGTGSGCIALALAKNLNRAQISALDVSHSAIQLAKKNAQLNNLSVDFIVADIVNYVNSGEKYNVIVSNPPYVLDKEKELMHENVLNYEPHLALFVPDNDPLFFYKIILNYAKKALAKTGSLYFEINEKYGAECRKIIDSMGFAKIEVRKDINGKARMIKAVKLFD
ncbi:MAG: peptide chain release factor N(5)-glutamine methyltransferase [Chlorobi bacterium]|nr:peptide chain release factor N(5)-glutamine methyltransferase [Chlorobiota bacterium]